MEAKQRSMMAARWILIIPAVTSGKADLGAGNDCIIGIAKKNADFTDTYATATQVIIVKEGSDAGPDDLRPRLRSVFKLGTIC